MNSAPGARLGAEGVDVTNACGVAGRGCDPATALFWGGVHPTSAAHRFIAERFVAELGEPIATRVPEPSSLAMMLAGALVVIGSTRRRRDQSRVSCART